MTFQRFISRYSSNQLAFWFNHPPSFPGSFEFDSPFVCFWPVLRWIRSLSLLFCFSSAAHPRNSSVRVKKYTRRWEETFIPNTLSNRFVFERLSFRCGHQIASAFPASFVSTRLRCRAVKLSHSCLVLFVCLFFLGHALRRLRNTEKKASSFGLRRFLFFWIGSFLA